MLSFGLAEGTLQCTLLSLNGTTRNEQQSAHFKSESEIPEIMFSRKERFRFTLKIRKEGRKSPLTGVTSYSQQGELSFHVFLEGVQRASFFGSNVFPIQHQDLNTTTQEYSFTFPSVAINQGIDGARGFMRIELRFTLLT